MAKTKNCEMEQMPSGALCSFSFFLKAPAFSSMASMEAFFLSFSAISLALFSSCFGFPEKWKSRCFSCAKMSLEASRRCLSLRFFSRFSASNWASICSETRL